MDRADARAALDALIGDAVDAVEQATGERLLVRPSVLDASLLDIARMRVQTEHFAAAYDLIVQWIAPGEDVRLGDRLKVVPTDVAAEITAHLVAAGLS